MQPERECARLHKALDACAVVHEHNVKLKAERDQLRKLFDDAGQGEHNVLALVDHYQRHSTEADERLRTVRAVLEKNGCDCECHAHYSEHTPDCERCLACRVGLALLPVQRDR